MTITNTTAEVKFEPIKCIDNNILNHKNKPNYVLYKWKVTGSQVGNASGGTIDWWIYLGNQCPTGYYIITDIYTYTPHATGAFDQDYSIYCNNLWWEKYFNSGGATMLAIWASSLKTTMSRTYPQADFIQKPIYIGKPRESSGVYGMLNFSLYPNINADNHYFQIHGLCLREPVQYIQQ